MNHVHDIAGNEQTEAQIAYLSRELEAKQQELRLISENSGLGTWERNLQTNHTVFNEQWAAMLGYTISELTPCNHSTWKRLVHPDDRDEAVRRLTACIGGETPNYECEFRMRHKDGHWLWIRAQGRVIANDENGSALLMFGTHTDVTALKKMEFALQASEGRVQAKLNALLDPADELELLTLADVVDCTQLQSLMDDFHALTDIGVGIVDTDGNVIARTGWQDICTNFHRSHPDTLRNCIESNVRHSAGIEPGTFKAYKCKNNMWDIATPVMIGKKHMGNLFLCQFLFDDEVPELDVFREQAHRYGFDEAAYLAAYRRIPRWSRETVDKVMAFYCNMIGMISSFSYSQIKLARTSESLRRSEQQFRSFVENANDLVYALSPEGVITYVSPNWNDFMGEPAEHAIGNAFYPYIHPEDRQRYRSILEKALLNGERQNNVEYRIVRRDGSWRWHVSNGGPIHDVSGTLSRFVGIARDVTDAKQAEAEREQLQLQLTHAQKLDSIGRLAGGVAHDFNNMLMGVMSYVDLGSEDLAPDHPVREWLDEIKLETERAANLTRQLLAFARQQTVAPQLLDLNNAVRSMLNMLRRLIGEDINLSWQPGAETWLVKIDPGQFDQVLANLCVNARDAIGGRGGTLSIETRNVSVDAAICTDQTEATPGDYAMLAVSDDGCGMDRETLKHIFEPFFTTKAQGKGTGLGLATVYGIVKQNSGFFNVYSEPGEGTTFRIYLPCARETAIVQKNEQKILPRSGSETIMLVEDERSVRTSMSIQLKKLGYTVYEAESAEVALRLAADFANGIDLLLTDVVMPGMSGRELADKLVAEHPAMQVLYMSGYTADIIAHRGILQEGVNFISKPASCDALAAKVREILDDVNPVPVVPARP